MIKWTPVYETQGINKGKIVDFKKTEIDLGRSHDVNKYAHKPQPKP